MTSRNITPGMTYRLRAEYGNPGEGSVPAGTLLTVREYVPAGVAGGSTLEDTVIVEGEAEGQSRAFGLTPRQILDLLEPV